MGVMIGDSLKCAGVQLHLSLYPAPQPEKGAPYDLRVCSLAEVRALCEVHHGYAGAGGYATYAFGVYEEGRMIAGYAWQPPAYGSAQSVCPEAPQGVLSLSRMVAVPRSERALNHVSRPLRKMMTSLIDRGRWPVLVTYHDEGEGHTGHVYKCSGWKRTVSNRAPYWVDQSGARADRRVALREGYPRAGVTTIHRWEHRVCQEGKAAEWMESHGWKRVPVPGRVWRSGNPAFQYVKDTSHEQR